MPEIGDFVLGREIGSSQDTTRFIWGACIDCGGEGWRRYIVKEARPAYIRCASCAHKLIQSERKAGKRPPIIYTPEKRHNLSQAKMGVKNPNYHKYGELNAAWHGGRSLSDGYIRVWVSCDDFFSPMRDMSGKVAEHRLVMAKHLNRCLLPWEVVHHLNNNRSDNRLENLRLLSDRKYHMIDTQTKRYIRTLENKIRNLEHGIKEIKDV